MDLETDPSWLAEGLTDFGFDRELYTFGPEGFAPYREEYTAACVNLAGRSPSTRVGTPAQAPPSASTPRAGSSSAPTAGRSGSFTGEVSIHGIYGHL